MLAGARLSLGWCAACGRPKYAPVRVVVTDGGTLVIHERREDCNWEFWDQAVLRSIGQPTRLQPIDVTREPSGTIEFGALALIQLKEAA